jgi:hypothetical protein
MTCFTAACPSSVCDPPIYADPCCFTRDYDHDGDVDLADYVEIHAEWAGPQAGR